MKDFISVYRVLFLYILCLIAPPVLCADIFLVKDHAVDSVIVIPDEAWPVHEYGAEELQYHVYRSTGCRLSIYKESKVPDLAVTRVYIGPCTETLRAGLPVEELSANSCLIQTEGNAVYLAGADSEGPVFGYDDGHGAENAAYGIHENLTRCGSLFAVYEFLERYLEAKWLWPGPLGEVIPKRASFSVPNGVSIRHEAMPYTRWRDYAYMGTREGWSNPENFKRYQIEQAKWLRRHRFAKGIHTTGATHAFSDYWERFSETHPEYFNLLPDGSRDVDPVYRNGYYDHISMCVSEPGLWQQVVEDWKEKHRENPQYRVDCGENDALGMCTCAQCRAWDRVAPDSAELIEFFDHNRGNPIFACPAPESRASFEKAVELFNQPDRGFPIEWPLYLGSLSDRYAKFYAAVYEEAVKVDPEARAVGMAYANYWQAPLDTRLNENIEIEIVPPYIYPMDETLRTLFRQQWQGWADTGATLMLRPNWNNTGHNMPLNYARKVGEDVLFAFTHVPSRTMGGDFDALTGQYSAQGLTLYTIARCFYRHEATVEDVFDEFYSAFGPAAGEVAAYFDYLEGIENKMTIPVFKELAEKKGVAMEPVSFFSFYRISDQIFQQKHFEKGQALLKKALSKVPGESIYARRIVFLESGLEHARLTVLTEKAFSEYKKTGEIGPYADAYQKLMDYRALIESNLGSNMGYLKWAEKREWDMSVLD